VPILVQYTDSEYAVIDRWCELVMKNARWIIVATPREILTRSMQSWIAGLDRRRNARAFESACDSVQNFDSEYAVRFL